MPDNLHQLIAEKRKWAEPLGPHATKKGFRGWYSSKYLPHFDAPSRRQFVTYRLSDSLPVSRRLEWEALLKSTSDPEKQRRLEGFLDQGWGERYLQDSRIAQLVQENLWHHDGQSYRLLAWVIMPNHVHVLIETNDVPLGNILKKWKSYTAKLANRILRRTGAFWEEDYFDRYVRNEKNFRQYVRYIESNPVKARLVRQPEDWLWSSARYRSREDMSAQMLTHRQGSGVGTACPHERGDEPSPPRS